MLVLLAWRVLPAAAAPPHYTLEVVPQFPAVELTRVWDPVLARLGARTGATFTLKVAKDIPSFEHDVMAGTPDFAYLNPYHQLQAHAAQGYIPLVRDRTLLTGILVVRDDDPITQRAELQGRRVAFPAPNGFGASLLIRAQLAEQDHVRITPYYAKTHTNAYRQVVTGQTAAAGGVRATLAREPEAVQRHLRVLFETDGAAPHPLSAHPRVPAAMRQLVADAMRELAQEPALRPSFHDIPMPDPVPASQVRDYDPLARLHLDRYVQ
jgi:phosphonate transport system substrate-binding protein